MNINNKETYVLIPTSAVVDTINRYKNRAINQVDDPPDQKLIRLGNFSVSNHHRMRALQKMLIEFQHNRISGEVFNQMRVVYNEEMDKKSKRRN